MAEFDQPEQHEKTEEPTHRRLEDARRRGDIAKSQEVTAWFVTFGACLFILLLAPPIGAGLIKVLSPYLAKAHAVPVDGAGIGQLLEGLMLGLLGVLGLPLIGLMLVALGGHVFQNGVVWSAKQMEPKLSKISPVAGFKRLFSVQSLVNFAKSVAKLAIVGGVIVYVLWPERDWLNGIVGLDVLTVLGATQTLSGKALIAVLVVLTVLAAADYLHQRTRWWQKLRMTVQELKDEYKQLEGDPLVRAKLRQIRIERGKKRMMANVPRASVVITNPTHYAVALEYEKGMNAPVCLAKGVDAVALKIKEIAKEHNIPIVENPPLARALHAAVDVDEEIPPEHYKAVAEVIGFVMRARAKAKARN